jgi:hypothetical protein
MQESECERSRQEIARALAKSNTEADECRLFRVESNKSQFKLARKVQRCDRSAGGIFIIAPCQRVKPVYRSGVAQHQRFPAFQGHPKVILFKYMVQTLKATAGCLTEEFRKTYPNPNHDRELQA